MPIHELWTVTWAKNMISSSRESLNWSGVSSKTASVDLERIVVDFHNLVSSLYSLEVSELLLKFLFIRLSIPLDQVLSRASIRIKSKLDVVYLQLGEVVRQLVALSA